MPRSPHYQDDVRDRETFYFFERNIKKKSQRQAIISLIFFFSFLSIDGCCLTAESSKVFLYIASERFYKSKNKHKKS